MVESLSVASLSVASKFTESFAPSIDEIQVRGGKLLLFSTSQLLYYKPLIIYQFKRLLLWLKMENQEHTCDLSTIQRMEMTLLQALEWRLRSTTSYSFAELLLCSIDFLQPTLHRELITGVTNLLLHALSGTFHFHHPLQFSTLFTRKP